MYHKDRVQSLFAVLPPIRSLLRDAKNLRVARGYITAYIVELKRTVLQDLDAVDSLEWSVRLSCIEAFRNMVAKRSARLARFDILELLWDLARERWDDVPKDLSDAFFEDLIRVLQGMVSVNSVYAQENVTAIPRLRGREAAIQRSGQLDQMVHRTEEFFRRYPCGLQDCIRAERDENRKRILGILEATANDWQDSAWQMRNIIRSGELLAKIVVLSDEERDAIEMATEGGLPFGVTPYYAHLMDWDPHRVRDHAVRAQVIPPLNYVRRMLRHRENELHSLDFMMESDTSPIDLITRRYPRIVIFKPYNTCSQICVYCQRNWEIDDVLHPYAMADEEKIEQALQWIQNNSCITEVLVTGGDPLVMEDQQLRDILTRVAGIPHVERIRLGTRTPVVLPQRLTDELLDMITSFHVPGRREIAFVTHFEHPYEITPESMACVQRIKRRGVSVYNQTVFTVENSRRFENCSLRRWLRLIGVDPYYTFNTKGKEETRNYRVPMARLQQEVSEEARLFPGLMRTDEPVYNVPKLGKNYLRAKQNHTLLTILPTGQRVYEFHPWEKYSALVDTYIDRDVPIFDYLMELQRRGEDPKEYESIYYYF